MIAIYFLRDFSTLRGVKGATANQISNRMPIWKTTNQRIGMTAPEVYLKDFSMCSEGVLRDLSDYFAIDSDLVAAPFSADNYEIFCIDRREKFVDMICGAVSRRKEEIVPREEI